MKRITFLVAVALGATALPLFAQQPEDRPVPLPVPQDVVTGEAYFLERIAVPPDAKLFVSLVGRVAGADYLPLATGIFPARNGTTSFRLLMPQGMAPAGPYRVQAWIVADNRLWMNGALTQTMIDSLNDQPKIRLKIQRAPQNMDGGGEEQPSMNQDQQATEPLIVRGTIVKRDRRALAPDAQIEVTLSDVSLADAPSKVMGKQSFSSNGKQVPIAFAVPVAAALEPRRRYSLMVRINEDGKLTYISDTIVPVTPDNANETFSVNVVPVGAG